MDPVEQVSPAPIELGLGGVDPSEPTAESAAVTPPSEPMLVDVWRPGRPEGARRRDKEPRETDRIALMTGTPMLPSAPFGPQAPLA